MSKRRELFAMLARVLVTGDVEAAREHVAAAGIEARAQPGAERAMLLAAIRLGLDDAEAELAALGFAVPRSVDEAALAALIAPREGALAGAVMLSHVERAARELAAQLAAGGRPPSVAPELLAELWAAHAAALPRHKQRAALERALEAAGLEVPSGSALSRLIKRLRDS
jgi:hypothetical protein